MRGHFVFWRSEPHDLRLEKSYAAKAAWVYSIFISSRQMNTVSLSSG